MNPFPTNVASDALVQQLGWTLVHTLWQGVVIVAALALLLRLLRAAPPNLRYVVSCAAMSLMVASAIATFVLLAPPQPQRRPVPVDVQSIVLPLRDVAPTRAPAAPRVARGEPLRYVVTAWAVGVAAMALWHVGGWILIHRLRRGRRLEQLQPTLDALSARMKVARRVLLLETLRVDVPATFGVLRPVVVMPAALLGGLSPQQLEAILAHELAHVRRHDYLLGLAQAAVETLFFYHPATWWISAQVTRERENCCDDIAAAACGDERAYAAALALLEERRAPAVAQLAPAASGANLIDRVRRLLRLPPPPPRRINRAGSLAAAALAVACVAVPLGIATAQQKQPAPSAPPTAATASSDKPAAHAPTPAAIEPDDLKVIDDPRIAGGDRLTVSIQDLVGPGVETVKHMNVRPTGTIDLPYAGAVQVGGLSAREAERAIVKAYRDGKFMPNAIVSVQIQQAVNILGQVDRPGQYTIAKPEFRVLDALALAGGRPDRMAALTLVRRGDGRGGARSIAIPLDKLSAGDPSVNLVVRADDTLIAAAGADKQHDYLKVTIAADRILLDGKPAEWATVRQAVEQIDAAKRSQTVLEVSAASPDVTVERFFGTTRQLQELVDEFKLAYLSQTGIAGAGPGGAPQPASTTAPATAPVRARAAAAARVYYMVGHVDRPGAYSFTGRPITLTQAIAAAGGPRSGVENVFVSVVRRDGDAEFFALENARLPALLAGGNAGLPLAPDDVVRVTEKPLEVTRHAAQRAAIRPVDADAPPGGEYYLDGHVSRPGVYSLTGLKVTVKQAISAAGGLDAGVEDAFINVVRRAGQRESFPLVNVRYSELMSGVQPDAYLQANDVIRIGLQPSAAIRADAEKAATRPATAPASAPAPPAAAAAARDAVLGQQHAALELALVELREKYGAQHPAVRSTQRMLDDVQRLLAAADTPTTPPAAPLPLATLLEQRGHVALALLDLSARLGENHPQIVSMRRLADGIDERIAAQLPLTPQQIASVDTQMSQLLRTQEEMEFKLAKLAGEVGPRSRLYLDAARDVEVQKLRVAHAATLFRKSFHSGPPEGLGGTADDLTTPSTAPSH